MIGKTILHYKILEKLGEGGMGVVYKAQDINLDRPVAIKFLPRHLTAGVEETKRFKREAKAAAALNHPNLATIYAIEELEDEQQGKECFIVMEYIDGQELREKIKTSPPSGKEIIRITYQIAAGLNAAHNKGIVHRDIKSSNIMITRDGQVKIMDFGLAKLAGQTLLTKTGTTMGTVAYMSPEQARGETVDQRSDIWSLGVLIYEMVTGQLPFKGEFDQAVIYSILNEEPAPVDTDISPELSKIITKSLKKDVAVRYQDTQEIILELEGLAEPSPIAYKPGYSGKRKYILATVLLLSLCVIVMLTYWLLKSEQGGLPEWENSIAVLPFDNISADPEQEYFCDGMTEQIISNLAKLPRLKVISRTSVMNYKHSDKTIPQIGKELNVAYVLEGSVRRFSNRLRITAQLISTEDDFHVWSEDYDKEYQDLFHIQDDISGAIAGTLLEKISPQETQTIKSNYPNNIEAYEYYLKGKYLHIEKYIAALNLGKIELAKGYLQSAVDMLKKSITMDRNFADAYAALCDVYNTYYYIYDYYHSEEEKNKCWNLQKAYLDTALSLNPKSAEAIFAKRLLHQIKYKQYLEAGNYEMYDFELNEYYGCLKKTIKYNPNHEYAYRDLGGFLQRRGLYQLAIKSYHKSIEVNPLDNFARSNLAGAYFKNGEFQKAESQYHDLIESPPMQWTLIDYSHLLITVQRFAEAESILVRIKKTYPRHDIRSEQALIYASQGMKQKALDTYQEDDAAGIFALLGMNDKALKALSERSEKQLKLKNSEYINLQINPFFNNLRAEPRFQEILSEHKKLYEENLNEYEDIDL
jgi:serine/threonine protein kinase/regulator of sirC expression with transglutaminase-like and TPR domain